MSPQEKTSAYEEAAERIRLLLGDSGDWIAAMATVSAELHHAFAHFDWTGFYRMVRPGHLQVGPYQGGHGCIDIPVERGVCGAAARSKATQRVDDVALFPGHIACSSETRSEIVVPVLSASGSVIAVLDIDSNSLSAFDDVDVAALEALCSELGRRYGSEAESALVD